MSLKVVLSMKKVDGGRTVAEVAVTTGFDTVFFHRALFLQAKYLRNTQMQAQFAGSETQFTRISGHATHRHMK